MTARFRLVPAGDSALVVEWEARIDPAINARAVRLAGDLQGARIAGVRDVVPTYNTVAIHFDPLAIEYGALIRWVDTHAGETGSPRVEPSSPIRIPVCYGGDLGPDLADVAAFAHMAQDEVIALHAATMYRVFMLGFVAGFAYMGIVDARLQVPRLDTPRLRVPQGSVGIAGPQTGIYPSETPGGWRLIGRTRVRPFDPARALPFAFNPGDTVQFVPVGRREYDAGASA